MTKKRMPPTRKGRSGLLLRNSSDYISRMSQTEIDRLLFALSKTQGLDAEDVEGLKEDLYNVDWEYVPSRLKE